MAGELVGKQTRKVADLIALLNKKPRTRRELMELAGVDPKTVDRWIHALADEGVIEIVGEKRELSLEGSAAKVWGWVRFERAAA